MDKNLDNILQSIKSLSPEDTNKIIYFLLEQNKANNLTEKEKEITTFVNENANKLDKCSKEIKELLLESKRFIDELKRSA